MDDFALLVEKMQRVSETAQSAAEVFRCYAAETRDAPSDGTLVQSLVRGFGVPIPVAMKALRWQGFGLRDGLDDDELERLVGPWVLSAPDNNPSDQRPVKDL